MSDFLQPPSVRPGEPGPSPLNLDVREDDEWAAGRAMVSDTGEPPVVR